MHFATLETATRKILKHFSMDAIHLLSSLMMVRSLDLKNDEFRPCNEGVICLNLKFRIWHIAIGLKLHFLLLYWLAMVLKPTKQHWNDVKHILGYLKGTEDLGLFYRVGHDNNIK